MEAKFIRGEGDAGDGDVHDASPGADRPEEVERSCGHDLVVLPVSAQYRYDDHPHEYSPQ